MSKWSGYPEEHPDLLAAEQERQARHAADEAGWERKMEEQQAAQQDQPSPSKWAVEAATEVWRNNFDSDFVDWVLAHPKSYPNRTSEIQRDAAIIDRAISSALAERDAVLKGVEDRLEDILHSLTDCGQRCLPSTRILATDLLTKLRSLKR